MAFGWGIVSTGRHPDIKIAPAMAAADGAALVGVCSRDQQRAEAFAHKHHARAAYSRLGDLLADSRVDGVFVASPNALHAEHVIQAAEAGKHVLCEKPLARTPDECERVVREAEQRGLVAATGFNYRFYPSMRKARELLDSGMIGELDHIRSYAGYSATDHNPWWVHDAATMGGGALRDNGIHLIDLTRWFLGEVADIRGLASDRVWRFPGCEDNGFALLRGANGAIASLHANWNEWAGYRFAIEIYGAHGCIRATCFPMMTRVIWMDRPGGKPRRRTYRFPGVFLKEHLRSYRWLVLESFVLELDAFRGAIEGRRTPLATAHDGMRAVEIAHAVAHAPAELMHAQSPEIQVSR